MTELIDYPTLCQYAASQCNKRGIRASDVDDIAHDAWLNCQHRARLANAEENPSALARRIMYTAVSDAIRKYRRWNGHDNAFQESDEGAAAERTFLAADDWENPFWLRLFVVTRKEIERDARLGEVSMFLPKAINALLKDSRLAVARQVLKVSYRQFGTILRKLKVRFDLCFRAYQAFLAYRAYVQNSR